MIKSLVIQGKTIKRCRTKFYCKCGCGELVSIYRGKPRKFIQYHNTRFDKLRELNSKRMQGNKLFLGGKLSESAKKKISLSQMGTGNSMWKGGRTIAGNGYVFILRPDHPFCDVNGRIKEERLIMEKHLGRYLTKKEIVHHKNKIKTDNRIENLQIVSSLEHSRIHHTGNKYNLGRKHSIKEIQQQSERMKKHIVTIETRQKLSISNKGKKRNEETRLKMSKQRIGLKDSLQTRINKSKAIRLWWQKRKGVLCCDL